MQIFAVDSDPKAAARALGDKHVVKMCLETAQILCTVSWIHGQSAPYQPTHVSHPCVRWTSEFAHHWEWVHAHGLELGREYEFRFRRQHASAAVIKSLSRPESIRAPRIRIQVPSFTTRSLLPRYQRIPDPVSAHRQSYVNEKAHIAIYARGREPPDWIADALAFRNRSVVS